MRLSPILRVRRLAAAIEGRLANAPDRRPLCLLGAAAFGFLCDATPASATTYTVDSANDVTTPGKTTLRQAVFEANGSANNIVQFDASLNGSTITLSQGEISITQPMYIVGPGAGQLTISGNDTSRIFAASTGSNTPIVVKLSGLTLVHGKTNGAGGAVYAHNASLTIEDSVLSNNAATSGGALYAGSGSGVASASALTRDTITNNSATQAAGADIDGGDTLTVVDSIFDGNIATNAAGAMRIRDVATTTTLQRCRFNANHATSQAGGALVIANSTTFGTGSITDTAFTGNQAGTDGGALALDRIELFLGRLTISGNSANGSGGGMSIDDSSVSTNSLLTIDQITVSGNTANDFGGGIDAHKAEVVGLNDSLISGNSVYNFFAPGGGGGIAIGAVGSNFDINNTTIYGNYAYNNGGGIGIFGSPTTHLNGATIAGNNTFNYDSNGILGGGTSYLFGCIVTNNSSHAGNVDVIGSFIEVDSLIRNPGSASLGGFGNKNGQDPQLGPLTVNGGPTLTMLPALTSPALDSGSTGYEGTADQRGVPRNINGTSDMGAVERQYPEVIIFRDGFDSS